ncbi:MAG: 50S ribosomal protein L18, partial [Proteobacteria bacterium]
NMYAQLIDDLKGLTLVSASTLEDEVSVKSAGSIEGAKAVGALLAQRAKAKGISGAVFDRSGYLYHGRVKALADSARESGLKF